MNPTVCPICSKPLADDAPQGICPSCLMKQAVNIEGAPPTPPAEEMARLAAAFPELVIAELIGQGGMGRVYRAQQPKLGRTVALKVLAANLADDPEWLERFTREARALARLSHPHIVQVFDFGEKPMPFLLMEHVDGVNLRQAMEHGRLTAREALLIVPKLCEALHYAHEHGVLHRDIKPENILIDAEGRVKVVDFGLAKLRDESALQFTLTQSGAKLGTVAYMAPEQIERPADVDHRADIYSLGVVFYEMLTGGLPLGRFPAPSEAGGVDARLDGVVFRTLEKQREKRFQSADEMKSGIESAADGRPVAAIEKLPLSSHRTLTAAVAGLVAAVLALAGTLVWFIIRASRVENPGSAAVAASVPAPTPVPAPISTPAPAPEKKASVPYETVQQWVQQASRTDANERDAGLKAILDALNSADEIQVLAGLSAVPQIGHVQTDKTAMRDAARKLLSSEKTQTRMAAVSAVLATNYKPADIERVMAMLPGAKDEELGLLTGALGSFCKQDFTGSYGEPMLQLLERGMSLAMKKESHLGFDERTVLGVLWGAKFSPAIEARIIEWSRIGERSGNPIQTSSIGYNVFYFALSVQANKSTASVKRLLELAQHPDTINIAGRCLWGLKGTVAAKEDQALVAGETIKLLENRAYGYQWRQGLGVLEEYATKEHLPALEGLAMRVTLPEEAASQLRGIIAKLKG